MTIEWLLNTNAIFVVVCIYMELVPYKRVFCKLGTKKQKAKNSKMKKRWPFFFLSLVIFFFPFLGGGRGQREREGEGEDNTIFLRLSKHLKSIFFSLLILSNTQFLDMFYTRQSERLGFDVPENSLAKCISNSRKYTWRHRAENWYRSEKLQKPLYQFSFIY